MKTVSRFLFLMLGLVTVTCFTACSSDEYDPGEVQEKDPVKVTGLTLDKYKIKMSRNSTDVITATVSPKNAANKEVTWKSSDSTVVKVVDGKITSNPDNDPLLGYGTVTITATTVDQGIKAECIVTVEQFSGVTYPSYPDRQQW